MSIIEPPISNEADFLLGGGEMGALMRSLDGSATPLGPIEGWPQSLRTAVSILLNSKYPMFIAWGEKLAFLYNDGYRPIFGAKHPAALGQPFAEVWSEIWDDIRPLVDRALRGEATWSDDLGLFMERSGYLEETYFTFSYSPIRSEHGVGGMFCACTETTDKVLGERRLRCLRDLAAIGSEAKTVEDAYAMCLRVIETFTADIPFALLYRLEGDGSARLIGSANAEPGTQMAPRRIEGAHGLWPLEHAAVGQAHVVDLPRRVDGAPRSLWGDALQSAIILPISDRGHEHASAALVLGVSPRRALDGEYRSFLHLVATSVATTAANALAFEQEHRRAEALAELDRAKTTFFSNVSHEFRTPLTLMLAPLQEALENPDLPTTERRQLEMAHRNALRLLKLVNGLLDFSRIEAGRAQAGYEPVDLGPFTTELASNFQSACERAGLRLVVDCPPPAEPVYVDPDMWEKIVLNLVSNAFKFTFEGEIVVALRARDEVAELSVRDTGVGIPPHELPHVFERFHRVETSRGRTHEGSGIGLALVQELVKLHGGAIRVDSVVQQGTTFTVSIPLGRKHLTDERIAAARSLASTAIGASPFVEEAMRWLPDTQAGDDAAGGVLALPSGRPSYAPPTADLSAARILWADDNADMRDYVSRLLGSRYQVEAVADGEAALAAARANPPDLVIADVMMPGLDGFGLLRELRADMSTREIPVMLLSARAGEEARVEGLRAGADDYLTKPFAARELLARVEAHLNAVRIRREGEAALRESEARFRDMADAAPVMVWVSEPDGASTFLSRSWYEATGQTPETALGLGWLDAVHPDDRDHTRQTFLCANERHERFELEYRLRQESGEYRWAIDSARPRFDADGGFLGYIGSVIDIDARKKAEEHRQLLVEELNHRVKNTLAIVQGLAQQTFKGRQVPDEVRKVFEGRLAALAAAHSLLTRTNWQKAMLDELTDESMHACGPSRSRISFEGPAVVLEPKQAVTIALAFHELCTNAMKYGALSNDTGRISIAWQTSKAPEPKLSLVWRERDGPAVLPPKRRGFGLRMIEQALAQDLGGEVSMDFDEAGLVCTIHAALPQAGRPAP